MFLVSRLQNKAPAQLVLAIALLAGSIGGIQGCASLQADYDEPVVTVTSFRAVPAEGAALSFEIGLRVVNPNSEALELQGIAYTISLEGHKLITGVGKDLPVVEGYSEETFTLQASASMFQAIQLFSDLMREPKESLQYELETKLDVGTFYPAIRVRKSGEISLQPAQ
jgi:LEA14-like dessication related protein